MLIRTQSQNAIFNLNNFHDIHISNYENSEICTISLSYNSTQTYILGRYNSKEDALMVMNIIEYYYSHYNNNVYHMPQEDEVPGTFNS